MTPPLRRVKKTSVTALYSRPFGERPWTPQVCANWLVNRAAAKTAKEVDVTIPRYVVGTAAEATRILHWLSRTGWHPRAGFGLPPSGSSVASRLVLYGRVPTLSLAAVAVAAANRGVGIVAIADAASPPGRMLLSAMEGLGTVHQSFDPAISPDSYQPPRPVPNGSVPALTDEARIIAGLLPEQRALLGRLANGETIATAAAAEYLSLRTANRRIAQARQSLGVRTTREAVLVYIQQRRSD